MRPVDYSLITEKRCTKCKIVKPAAEFGKYNDPKQPINGWRYYSRCVECSRSDSREYGTSNRQRRNRRLSAWRQTNPTGAARNDRRKRTLYKYGITVDDVEQLFAAQSGRCLICMRETDLCVDHDHTTGEVRGGLCNRCNVVLGRVETDISYADRHELGEPMRQYLESDGRAALLLAIANSKETPDA